MRRRTGRERRIEIVNISGRVVFRGWNEGISSASGQEAKQAGKTQEYDLERGRSEGKACIF